MNHHPFAVKHVKSIQTTLLLLGGLLTVESRATPIALSPVADARIVTYDTALNDGNSYYLSTFNHPEWGNIQRSLLRFDLSPLPAGETVVDARLSLTYDSALFPDGNPLGRPMEVYRVASAWAESKVTWTTRDAGHPWATPGGDFLGMTGSPGVDPYSTLATVVPDSATSPVTIEWTVTRLVQEWHSGLHPNHGLLLLSYPDNGLHFGARESALSGFVIPQLQVTTAAVPDATSTATLVSVVLVVLVIGRGFAVKTRRFNHRTSLAQPLSLLALTLALTGESSVTGRSASLPLATPKPVPGDILWKAASGRYVVRPALGSNGWLYAVEQEERTNRRICALDTSTGVERWSQPAGQSLRSPPATLAIAEDGTVLVQGDPGLLAMDGATGVSRTLIGTIANSVALGDGDTVYVTSEYYRKVFAIDGRSGKTNWVTVESSGILPSGIVPCAIGAGGLVYVADDFHKLLYAVDGGKGTKRWQRALGEGLVAAPAIGSNGVVYASTGGMKLHALNGSSGATLWSFILGGVGAEPVVGPDGSVYVACGTSGVYAFDGGSGSNKWHSALYNSSTLSPAISADGTLYVGTTNGLVALDATTGKTKWGSLSGKQIVTSPLVGPDGTIYVSTRDTIYAVAGTGVGAAGFWPMAGHDVRHTYRYMLEGIPVIVAGPKSTTLPRGTSAIFTVDAEGGRPFTYQWLKDGVPLQESDRVQGVQSATLTVHPLQDSDSGSYTVQVSNAAGGPVASSAGVLSVREPKAGDLLWIFEVGEKYLDYYDRGAPVVGLNGMVYVTGGGKIWALDGASGIQRWSSSGGLWLAVGHQGLVYTSGGDLSALDGSTGSNVWKWNDSGRLGLALPAIGGDGTLYVGYGQGVSALDGATGNQKWATRLNKPVEESVIGAEGTVYARSGGDIYALNPNSGLVVWQAKGNGDNLLVGPSNTVFAVSGSVLDGASGNLIRAIGGRWDFVSPPVLGVDGTLYVGSYSGNWGVGGNSEAVRWTSGQVLWTLSGDFGAPALAENGTLYASWATKLSALDTRTGKEKWNVPFTDAASSSSAPTIGADGMVYVCTGMGRLHAIYGGSPPAPSPWPMIRADAQHTGRARAPMVPARLELVVQSGEVRLSWGSDGFPVRLQSSETLGQGARWIDLSNAPTTGSVGSRLLFQDSATDIARFYRLVR